MKNRLALPVFSFVCALFLAASAFSADYNLAKFYEKLGLSRDVSYSADVSIDTGKASSTQAGKYHFKNGRVRFDGRQAGMDFSVIIDPDGVVYSYNAAMNFWIKTSIDDIKQQGQAMSGGAGGANFSPKSDVPDFKKTGSETVDGVSCDVYEAAGTDSEGSARIWVGDGVIRKIESDGPGGNRAVVRYTNVEIKDLDDSLFMPPEDARVQDMSAMMQGIMGEVQAAMAEQGQ
jgi:outer membrane lipoprotein-sorting protein